MGHNRIGIIQKTAAQGPYEAELDKAYLQDIMDRITGQGDGRISKADAQELVQALADGGKYAKGERPLAQALLSATNGRHAVYINGKKIRLTQPAKAAIEKGLAQFWGSLGGKAAAKNAAPKTVSVTVQQGTVTQSSSTADGTPLSQINKDVERALKLLQKATTTEPKSGRYAWQTSNPNNFRDVVTFRTSGKAKGSLERFAEANKIPKGVYETLRDAAAYGAHSTQGAVRGVLAFEINDKNIAKLQEKLESVFASRDADGNGKLDAAEQKDAKKTKNGANFLKNAEGIRDTKLTGLRTEKAFSQKVNYLVDLMYSNGSIYGQNHIDNLASSLSPTEANAVRRAYHAVSRYMSRGRTPSLGFICRDQRREVTRGLMRVFGASNDATEQAINSLKP